MQTNQPTQGHTMNAFEIIGEIANRANQIELVLKRQLLTDAAAMRQFRNQFGHSDIRAVASMMARKEWNAKA
jgi:hypothetical protein